MKNDAFFNLVLYSIFSIGNGFDLIAPECLAMPLWVPLIYRGARATGLHCQNDIRVDASLLRNPDDYIDTPAGGEFSLRDRRRLQSQHGRFPPAKRPNHSKLGRGAPFECDWIALEGCSGGGVIDRRFYVCRESRVLRTLAHRGGANAPSAPAGCLVAVRVLMVARGVPERFAEVHALAGGSPIGYVVSGGFSYSAGKGVGVAYVLANRIVGNEVVRLRSANSKEFRNADISILL